MASSAPDSEQCFLSDVTNVFQSVALGHSEAKSVSILSLQSEPAVVEAAVDEPAVEEAAVVEAAVEEAAVDEPAVAEPRRFTLIKCSKYEWILCRACFRRN